MRYRMRFQHRAGAPIPPEPLSAPACRRVGRHGVRDRTGQGGRPSGEPTKLPFRTFSRVGGGTAIQFTAIGADWRCALAPARCAGDAKSEKDPWPAGARNWPLASSLGRYPWSSAGEGRDPALFGQARQR